MSDNINITVNGQPESCPPDSSILSYLEGKGANPAEVVAEHNGEIVKPQSFAERMLREGDQIEFIRFVGGG